MLNTETVDVVDHQDLSASFVADHHVTSGQFTTKQATGGTVRHHPRGVGMARSTVRIAAGQPGESAEMDYGRPGPLLNQLTGNPQVVWALVVVLPHSQHTFVWLTKPHVERRSPLCGCRINLDLVAVSSRPDLQVPPRGLARERA
jgi:hypothetical protein